jgi:hypothetical protein
MPTEHPSLPRRIRVRLTPGAAVALVALFLALGGSAWAVGERAGTSAAGAQRACSQGNVRGVAHVTGAANVPGAFTGASAMFSRRFNCTGRAVQVRRLGIGSYEVRFAGNPAPTAIGSGGSGVQASAERIGPGLYRVSVYPSGRADPADFPFVLVLV